MSEDLALEEIIGELEKEPNTATESSLRNFLQPELLRNLNKEKSETISFQLAKLLIREIRRDLENISNFVSQYGEDKAFSNLNETIHQLSILRDSMEKSIENSLKDHFRNELLPIIMESDFCNYAYAKPRGYAGDFFAMEKIWKGRLQPKSDRYLGESERGRLINAFTLDMENCKANEHRVFYLKKQLLLHKSNTVASVGAGSAIELYEALREYPSWDVTIHLYDQDDGAIELSLEKLKRFKKEIIPHKGNVLRTILKSTEQYDFIYSSGLFDYFLEEASSKLIQKLWGMLSNNGTLLITNANPSNPTKLWMEFATDWYLKYKDIRSMLGLASLSEEVAMVMLEKDPFDVYQYVKIRKKVR